MKQKTKKSFLAAAMIGLVRLIYPKTKIEGLENLPDEPVIIVANHCQIHGPICCELFLPKNSYIWCTAQMMHLKDVPSYAFSDFWSQKPKFLHPLFKLISYLIAIPSVILFNGARTIPVYRKQNVLTTFRLTLEKLQSENHIVIFPEHDKKHNNIIYDFQLGFVDIAKLYFNRTGKTIKFVPLYVAPKLKKLCFGKPISFCHENPIEDERVRITDQLMKAITDIAVNLPLHTVIPYRNIPKKLYPKNKPEENHK